MAEALTGREERSGTIDKSSRSTSKKSTDDSENPPKIRNRENPTEKRANGRATTSKKRARSAAEREKSTNKSKKGSNKSPHTRATSCLNGYNGISNGSDKSAKSRTNVPNTTKY
jgi:hypothetical protein